MTAGSIRKHGDALKWIGVALVIKIPLFLFFSTQFYNYWPRELITNYLFIESGDTSGYYAPAENFVAGAGYNSFCRMPGLLPVYFFLRLVFNIVWTKTLIIVLQVLTGAVSVYLLAKSASLVFGGEIIFRLTFFLYAFSSFVSIWDHFGYSDSFSTSFLIFSVYFLLQYRAIGYMRHLFWSGLFITWSVFFRPVHLAVVPVLIVFYLVDLKRSGSSLKTISVFCLPIVFCLGLWTFKNYKEKKRFIPLQGPLTECFISITEEVSAIRGLIMAWGGDVLSWSNGSAGMWFFESKSIENKMLLIERNEVTSKYNYDSLVKLRQAYQEIRQDLPKEKKSQLSAYIVLKSRLYTASYKKEKPFNYYIINKLRLIRQLLFRKRLDDLPFPALNEMSWYHKVIKGGYFLLLLFVNFFGLLGCLLALWKRIYLAAVPLALIFVLAVIMCYVEQRYLVPVYPFMTIFSAWSFTYMHSLLKEKRREMISGKGI